MLSFNFLDKGLIKKIYSRVKWMQQYVLHLFGIEQQRFIN